MRKIIALVTMSLLLTGCGSVKTADEVMSDVKTNSLIALAKYDAKTVYQAAVAMNVTSGEDLTEKYLDEFVLSSVGAKDVTWDKAENKYTVFSDGSQGSVYICLSGVSLEKCV